MAFKVRKVFFSFLILGENQARLIFSYSVICVYICVWCVPKKSIKEFRNSSWYQSQFSETLIPSGHLLFRPSLIPAKSLWPYLNPIISLSHSGHQSLFSEPREKTFSDRSNRHHKTFTAGDFFGNVFFPHRKERLEEISNFSQSTGARKPPTHRPHAFFRPATASHTPAREGA